MSTFYKKLSHSRLAALTGGAILPLVGAAFIGAATPAEAFLVDRAEAQQGQGQGQGAGRDALNVGRGMGPGGAGRGQGRSVESDIFRDAGGRPTDRGGRPDDTGGGGPDSGKGGDYGDIVIILRADDGTPILDDNDNIQPCLTVDCSEYTQLVEAEDGKYELPEGAIAVEFGRLNVARSPSSVTDRALTELLTAFDGQTIDSLEWTDESGRLITPSGATIDSPIENLALYVALLEASREDPVDGVYTLSMTTNPRGHDPSETFSMDVSADLVMPLLASSFAAASDKFGDLTIDKVMGITGFLGLESELSALVSNPDYTYDRQDTYDGVMVDILQAVEIEGQTYYQVVSVNLYDVVPFSDPVIIEDNGYGIDTFTMQADDAVKVLLYVHDYAIDAE
ncbi:hypothetical protein [Halomonas sp. 3H]|uniref:hypothetical protein n=1 Tax=Halomonas sp. 3H TaxID=2952527 RepID=UPI0020B6C4C0|nr:hypothetical protein [Halomonas sp. 3H]